MNENLDLTKILEGCPEGTEFYSPIYGSVSFWEINNTSEYPIKTKRGIKPAYFTSDGKFLIACGECTLFPSKDQQDWGKFERFWDKPKVGKFDVTTLQSYDKILVRDTNNESWSCGLFSHIENLDYEYPVYTVGTCNKVCIPYNDETKHLVGTEEDCPDYYKWWEKEQ